MLHKKVHFKYKSKHMNNLHSAPGDNSIDFEPGLKPEDIKIESPAEHTIRMEELSKRFDLPKTGDNKLSSTSEEGLTSEQKFIQKEREFSEKGFGENLKHNAEIQNVVLDLIKEKGIEINKDIINRFIGFQNNKDSISIVTNEGVYVFKTEQTGEKVVSIYDIGVKDYGSFDVNTKGSHNLFGEIIDTEGGVISKNAEKLWSEYQPETLVQLYTEAEEILKKKQDSVYENETEEEFSERFKSYILDRNTKIAKGEAVESGEEFKTKMANINRQRLAIKMKKDSVETN